MKLLNHALAVFSLAVASGLTLFALVVLALLGLREAVIRFFNP